MRGIFIFIFFCQAVLALDNQHIFSLDNYSQNINYWLSPTSPNYTKPLLSLQYQNERLEKLKHRYFGTDDNDPSPWSVEHITSLINESNSILKAETKFLADFDNTKVISSGKLGYALNKRPYSVLWINTIAKNLNLNQFTKLVYNIHNRAITVNNVLVRVLPTDDPLYYNDKIAGEGYPFDNLQDSAIYTGTSLYVAGQSVDGKWSLVISPDIAGWVHTNAIAWVDDEFIATWKSAAYKNIVGITQNDIGIKDSLGNYLFSAYVGTILPFYSKNVTAITVLIPIRNQKGMAQMKSVSLSLAAGNILPIPATMVNFSKILSAMQQRTYGWGNLGMYTDCSSELKNIYALFGIYVPRNTKSIDNTGKVINLNNKSPNERLIYLMSHASPLLTFIHIKGHVMLYVGTYDKSYNGSNLKTKNSYPMTYQQVWGLRDIKQSYRAIIGQSVFLPLLENYAEDKNLVSQITHSMFKVIDLNYEPDKYYKPDLAELLY